MSLPSSFWITHCPEIHGGKPIFVGSRTQMHLLAEWLNSGKTLPAFSLAYPDVKQRIAAGAIELGFALQIYDLFERGRRSLASLSMARAPDIRERQPMFINSQTLVTDFLEWLKSGRSLGSFLTAHPDVDENDAKGAVELSLGYLAKDYFNLSGPEFELKFKVEITPAAHEEIARQFARAEFAKPCLMIERLPPKGEVTQSVDGKAIWQIERPYPLRTKIADRRQIDHITCDLIQVDGILVWLRSVLRPGEFAFNVSVQDGQLYVEPLAA